MRANAGGIFTGFRHRIFLWSTLVGFGVGWVGVKRALGRSLSDRGKSLCGRHTHTQSDSNYMLIRYLGEFSNEGIQEYGGNVYYIHAVQNFTNKKSCSAVIICQLKIKNDIYFNMKNRKII